MTCISIPPNPHETPETAELRLWFEEKVLDFDGYHTHVIGERTRFFSSGAEYRTLPQVILDGFPSPHPEWAGTIHRPSLVLMCALERYLQEIPSHFAQALLHDGCYFELRRFHPIHHLTDFNRMFSLSENEPADEGGSTHIFLLANDRRSAIEVDGHGISLSFHGDEERKEVFFRHLAQAAQEPEIPEALVESLSQAATRRSDFWSYTGQEKSPPGFQETQETTDLRQWFKDTVLTAEGWDLQSIGEETILFEDDYQGTLGEALLDGLPAKNPPWASQRQSPSKILPHAIAGFLSEVPSHGTRALHHDNCSWEFPWFCPLIEVPDASLKQYATTHFVVFARHPADHGGLTGLMFLANDRRSAIVFANQPGDGPYAKRFTIAFYGDEERKELLLSHLAKAAETVAT